MGAVAQRPVRQQELRPDDLISHVEPFDPSNYTNPDYYWGYNTRKFNELFEKINNAPRADERNKLARRGPADAGRRRGHAFLFQPQWPTVANKRLGVCGDMPDLHQTTCPRLLS